MLVVRMRQGGTLKLNIIYNFTAAIVYMNSSLNPFIYCFRSKDIRIAVFKLLGRKYTIDLNGDVVPVSFSTQKINSVKNSTLFKPSPHLNELADTQLWQGKLEPVWLIRSLAHFVPKVFC